MYDFEISENSHFQVCHFAMPPLGGVAENYKNYNTDAQLRSRPMQRYQKFALNCVPYTGFGAHKITNFSPVFSTTSTDLIRWCVRMQRVIEKF